MGIKDVFSRFLIILFVFSGLMINVSAVSENSTTSGENISDEVVVHFFWSDSCPHCAEEKPFLEGIEEKNERVVLKSHLVSEKESQLLYQRFNEFFDSSFTGVPMTIIGEKEPIRGFGSEATTGRVIEDRIDECLQQGCNDFSELSEGIGDGGDGKSEGNEENDSDTSNSSSDMNGNSTVDIPMFGEVSAEDTSLVVLTAMVAFVDGFNPCSLWVITFLLGVVVLSGSRKKTFAVGFTFLLITSTFYGLFIFGLLNVFSYIGHLPWIRALVAVVAVFFGLVNIKDFFWYKKGISFTIPERFKPRIFKGSRSLMSHSDSLPALVGGTALLAAGITLVELPCTAGFPVVWTNILSTYSPNVAVFSGLLLMYMIIYLLDELAVFFTVVFTMRKTRFQEEHGRLLKLIGGMIMVALAGTLLLAPGLMESIKGTVAIFGGSIVVSLLIYGYYKDEEGFEEENGNESSEASEGDD